MDLFVGGLHAKPSIDQYLHFHRNNPALVMLGKLGIAYTILLQERLSLLRSDPGHNELATLSGTWLLKLFRAMNADTELSNVADTFRNVSIICFNYDRCIELGFYKALLLLTGKHPDEITEVMSRLRIWHPYGTVGEAPYAHRGALPDDEPTYLEVIEGAKRLRTFMEGMNDETLLGDMHAAIATADQIVFLGFSYLDQNMDLLKVSGQHHYAIYATCLGVADPDVEQAKRLIQASLSTHLHGANIKLLPMTASQLFDAWGNTLRR